MARQYPEDGEAQDQIDRGPDVHAAAGVPELVAPEGENGEGASLQPSPGADESLGSISEPQHGTLRPKETIKGVCVFPVLKRRWQPGFYPAGRSIVLKRRQGS